MADVEIDWDSLSIHRGVLTVSLTGSWAHDARWVAAFNHGVPPMLGTSWGQITAKPLATAPWSQITAKTDATITVQTLRPGHANQLKQELEKFVTNANAKMASMAEYRQRTGRQQTPAQAELDARDQAMMDEFR
jgi:hypothetical protein